MRRQSKKFRSRALEVKALRQALIAEHPFCMGCGVNHHLACHEIAGGATRQAFLDQPCGILILCNYCNCGEFTDNTLWPKARQLALLKVLKPHWYDLKKFLSIYRPNAPLAITEEEVEEYAKDFRSGL